MIDPKHLRAIVFGPGHDHTDPLSSFERLLVIGSDPFGTRQSYLNRAGVWVTLDEGGKADSADVGLNMPVGSIEAIGLAIAQYQGTLNHGATEAKVLREWLAIEQGRVDRLIDRIEPAIMQTEESR